MIDAMRTLALDYLFDKLGDKNSPPKNLDDWYHELCTSDSEKLFPFLVESVEGIEEDDKVYIFEQDIDKDIVRLVPEDAEKNIRWLPFMKPTGSQSAQIGPVIKRTYSKGTGGGPSPKILITTMGSFKQMGCSNKPWGGYFAEIVRLLESPQLKLLDNSVVNWEKLGYANLLIAAVVKMGEQSL